MSLLACARVSMSWLALDRSPVAAASLCSFPAPTYTSTCYPPDQVKRVDRLLKVPPIDPTRAVAKLTGLPLTEVVASKRLLPTPSRRVVLLTWVYGTVLPGVPDPSPPLPKWVIVEEFAMHFKGLKGVQVGQSAGPEGPPGSVRVWQLQANLPRKSLAMAIQTNEDQATIRHIGRELIKESKQKGHQA